jgi:hypothetical protein
VVRDLKENRQCILFFLGWSYQQFQLRMQWWETRLLLATVVVVVVADGTDQKLWLLAGNSLSTEDTYIIYS